MFGFRVGLGFGELVLGGLKSLFKNFRVGAFLLEMFEMTHVLHYSIHKS